MTKWVLLAIVAFSLLIATGTAVLWWRGRAQISGAQASGAGSCAKCGTPRTSGDRFCSKCGALLE